MNKIDFRKRQLALAENLRKGNIDAYLVTRQGSLHYLCGVFMPWRGVALVTRNGDAILFFF